MSFLPSLEEGTLKMRNMKTLYVLKISVFLACISISKLYGQAPGGVAGPDFWVKSDAAGNIATAWKDHSANAKDISAVGTWTLSPADRAHNFHPYTTGYTGTKYFNSSNSSLNPTSGQLDNVSHSIFSAVRPTTAGTGRIIGIDNDGNGAEPGFSINNGKLRLYKFSAGANADQFDEQAFNIGIANIVSGIGNNPIVAGGTSTSAGGERVLGVNGVYKTYPNTAGSNRFHIQGQNLRIGQAGWDAGGPFPGDIMEVVWYKRTLTANEQSRVNSYLALKNGVTLGENYLNASSAVIWDRTLNTGFNSNIFGIVRDDASALYQKQASSANPYQKLVIGNGNSLFNTNAANTNSLSDGQFLIVGDNGLKQKLTIPFVYSAGTNGVTNYRFESVWKVENTGVGQVTVAWPKSFSNMYLVRSSDQTFATGNTYIPMTSEVTVSGVVYNTATVTLADGQFFTIAGFANAPGGVVNNLSYWYRADINAVNTGSGTDVTTWKDFFSGDVVAQMGTNALPKFNPGATDYFNFNPGINFTAGTQTLGNVNVRTFSADSYDVITFTKEGMTSGGSFPSIFRSLVDNALLTGDNRRWDGLAIQMNNSIERFSNTGGTTDAGVFTPAGAFSLTIPSIMYHTFTANTTTRALNGAANFATTTHGGTGVKNLNGGHLFGDSQFGGNGSDNRGFIGNLGETIIYGDGNLTAQERRRVDSYLAIKYGMTLDRTATDNYLASDGGVIWNGTTNTGYNDNVFGIAKDELSALYQKQSKSVNANQKMIIGAGNSLANTNAANTSTLANGQFLIVGDNGLRQSFTTPLLNTAAPGGETNIRFESIWKVQNTGGVGNVTVAWPKGVANLNLVQSTDAVFDASDSFTSMATEVTVNGVVYNTATVNLSNGQFFTFAGFAYAPGGVAGPDFWVKSDDAGNIATAWKDQSINEDNLPAVGTWALSPADKSHNFHPYTTGYTNGKYFNNLTSVLNPTNGQLNNVSHSIFSAVRPTTAGTGRIIGIDDDTNGAEPGFSIEDGKLRLYKFTAGANADQFDEQPFNIGAANIVSGIGNNPVVAGGTSTSAGGERVLGVNGVYKTYPNTAGTNRFHIQGQNLRIGYSTWDAGGPFPGDIMEVVWYKRTLTANEQSRVNSYLALKNGVTLNENYLATSSSVVWDRTNNTGYNSNIFGIARDNITDLHQKQSTSVNVSQKLVIGNSSSLFNTNADNTNHLTEGQFLIVGDNGLKQSLTTPLVYTAGTNGATNYRFESIWKAQNTGSVGNVTVAWPKGVANLYLVQSTDAVFDATDTFTSMAAEVTVNGVVYNTATATLANGTFFTFAGFGNAPGGVATSLSYWYRADKNATNTGATTDVTGWTDMWNGTTVAQMGTNALPKYAVGTSSYFNFNPGINFTAINQTIGNNSVQTIFNANNDLFMVTKEGMTSAGSPNPHFFSIGMDNTTATIDNWDYLGVWPSGQVERRVYNGGTNFPAVNPGYSTSIPSIMYYNFLNQPYSRGLNGAANGATYNSPGAMGIPLGGHIFGDSRFSSNNSDNGGFIGNIGETIIYGNGNLTTTERRKVDSYLAIKYGITLGQVATDHYLDTDGSIVWNGASNSTYNNNIFGVSRDDIEVFEQKVTKSVNTGTILTVATINDFVNPNQAATRIGFANDKTYFLLGDNNVTAIAPVAITVGGSAGQRIQRAWLSQRKNTPDALYFEADLSAYGASFAAPNNVLMLVADDAAFTTNVKSVTGTFTNGKWVFSNNFNTDNVQRYITFAKVTLSCTNPGLFDAAGVPSTTGISNLAGFTGGATGWPANVPNGHVVIESKNKGFVITRVSSSAAIVNPVEGMLIYDIAAACVKLFNGIIWNCLQKDCTN
jgi:hypothetical protein